jgi:hypothetical protein
MTQVTGAGISVLKYAGEAFRERYDAKLTPRGNDAYLTPKADLTPETNTPPSDPTQETPRERARRLSGNN